MEMQIRPMIVKMYINFILFSRFISDTSNLSVVYKGVHKGKPVAIKTLREAKNMDDFLVEASSMT